MAKTTITTTARAKTVRRNAGLLAGAGLCVIVLGGCAVDGTAVRAADTPTVAETSSARAAAPSSGAPSSAAEKSMTQSPESAPPSSSAPRRQSEEPSAGGSGVAGEAMTMTCDRYKRLTPDEQKEVTAALGERLGKKQLVSNDRSWAIVNTFCDKGLVRNSRGVTQSG